VLGRTYTLKATGHALAGGGGVMVRLAPQIAVEGGVLIGASRFDDYRFIGEFAWKDCLDQLDRGTPLPESISRCAGSRSTGRTVLLCYPPYFTEGTSDCDPPEIPYAGTSRNGTWVRAWIGVTLSLSTALSD
jgi:hypothetical protein